MRHGDKSFPAIYVMVVLAHVGAIAWVVLGARGCQQGLVASTAAKDSAMEKSALRLNLALPQSVAESLPPAHGNPQSDEAGGIQTHAASKGEDPASRLTLPASAERDAKVAPEPEPPVVREGLPEKPDLAKREMQAQDEAETQARQRDAIQDEKRRQEEELAAKEEAQKLALKQQADRNAAAQAAREAEQERKIEEIARKEEERKLARELDAERKAAEAERQRKVVEQRERERKQQEAASKKKEEERKLALRQEAERNAAAEAERNAAAEAARQRRLAEQRDEERRAAEAARQRRLAEQRDEERRAAEAAERQRQLAQQREEERRAAEAADERQRQLAEQREREEAKHIEKARVVGETASVSPAVVKPNLVAAEGGNGSSPEVVPAKPRGGGSPDAGVLDMDAYRATVQKMIQNRWTIPRGIVVENYPEVVVRIDRAGKVVFARNERNSGVPELDRSAINAVRIGSQLIPLPAGYDKDVYEVKVKFQVD